MRYLIVTPYICGALSDIIRGEKFDGIVCADASYDIATGAGLVPDIVIGDFDHGSVPDAKIVRVPCEKDDTDTMLCIKHAIKMGADEILIAGGIGGRLDHTVANLQSLKYAHDNGSKAFLRDGDNEAFLIEKGAKITRRDGFYLSLFAFGGKCDGVSICGTKYVLSGASLDTSFPLGVSNEITADYASVEVRSGILLAILSRK